MFAFKINYNNDITFHTTNSAVPLFNGNIAETTWRTAGDNIQRRYCYTYDKLNRLTDAWYQMPQASYPERHSYDEQLQYDKNGNITSLKRNGGLDTETMPVPIDDLAYTTYSGNQLLKIKDNSPSSQGFSDIDQTNTNDDYQYDGYGNMTFDLNKGITSISYNHLNLPVKIVFNGNETTKIEYLYDAVGTKVKKTVTNNGTVTVTNYVGGFQYAGSTLEFFPTAEGYVKYTMPRAQDDPGQYNYVYNYIDHLGNIRLSYTLDPQDNVLKILEENHYYPFGLKHKGYSNDLNIIIAQPEGIAIVPAMSNDYIAYNYKYQGQEWQDELGLGWYSFKWRNYDPAIGRFMCIDPLADKYVYNSPYAFQENKMGMGRELEGLELTTVGTHLQNKTNGVVNSVKENLSSAWEATGSFFTEKISQIEKAVTGSGDKNEGKKGGFDLRSDLKQGSATMDTKRKGGKDVEVVDVTGLDVAGMLGNPSNMEMGSFTNLMERFKDGMAIGGLIDDDSTLIQQSKSPKESTTTKSDTIYEVTTQNKKTQNNTTHYTVGKKKADSIAAQNNGDIEIHKIIKN